MIKGIGKGSEAMRTANARKQQKVEKPTPKLKVIKGGKGYKEPKRKRGRPRDPNRVEPWKTVLRIHPKLAKRLKTAAKENSLSVNQVLTTIITVWLDSSEK